MHVVLYLFYIYQYSMLKYMLKCVYSIYRYSIFYYTLLSVYQMVTALLYHKLLTYGRLCDWQELNYVI